MDIVLRRMRVLHAPPAEYLSGRLGSDAPAVALPPRNGGAWVARGRGVVTDTPPGHGIVRRMRDQALSLVRNGEPAA